MIAVANLASSHLITVENQDDSTDPPKDGQLTFALKHFWETESLDINLGELDQYHDHFYVTLSMCRGIIRLVYPGREIQLMSIIILILSQTVAITSAQLRSQSC